MGYSSNSKAYGVFNCRTSAIIECINIVINDSSTTRMVEFDDNDVFENWESVEGVTSNREFSTYAVFDEPPNTIDDEEKELYLPKWTKKCLFY